MGERERERDSVCASCAAPETAACTDADGVCSARYQDDDERRLDRCRSACGGLCTH